MFQRVSGGFRSFLDSRQIQRDVNGYQKGLTGKPGVSREFQKSIKVVSECFGGLQDSGDIQRGTNAFQG